MSQRSPGAKRRRPKQTWTLAGLVAALVGAAMLGHGTGLSLPLSWIVSITAMTFAFYGYDKAAARSGRSRIPEFTLHFLAVAGGTVGALAGMNLFRHKTVKGSFRFVFFAILILQVALAAWLVTRPTS